MSVRAHPRRLLLVAAAAGALSAPVSASAAPGTVFGLNGPTTCYVNSCAVQLSYDAAQMTGPGVVDVDWDYQDATGFTFDATQQCGPAAVMPRCLLYSPAYTVVGTHIVKIRVTDADSTTATGSMPLDVIDLPVPALPTYVPPASPLPTMLPPSYVPPVIVAPQPSTTTRKPTRPTKPTQPSSSGDDEEGYDLCRNIPPSVRCQPGGGRQTAGGGEKVSHKNWPAINGVFWQVMNSSGRTKVGGPDNDELLGHHGSDTLAGGKGRDVLWGDWDPSNNNVRQRDVLRGGAGNDFIYPSHGTSDVEGGPGKDYVWAFYGNGVIDCGPGYDTVRVRLNGAFKLRNCEVVGHFCQFGADGHGGCLKPGEKRSTTARRRT